MMPKSSATIADHRYAPMFVGDVYADRVAADRSPLMLSDGRPVSGATIAVNDFRVSRSSEDCLACSADTSSRSSGAALAAGESGTTTATASAAASAILRAGTNRAILGSLLFQTGGGDATDEVPLQHEEHDQHGQHDDHRTRQQQVVAGLVLPDRVQGERDRQRVLVLRGGRDQWPQEVVPRRQEREDA